MSDKPFTQREDSRLNGGLASKKSWQLKREPTVIDWDAAILRLKKMLNDEPNPA